MFWKKLVKLCKENGITPNFLCKEIGLSTATATKWKLGAIPRDTTISSIAEYFNVPMEYFAEEEKKPLEIKTIPVWELPQSQKRLFSKQKNE